MKKRGMGLLISLGAVALVLIVLAIVLIAGSGYNARLVLVNDGCFVGGEELYQSLYATESDEKLDVIDPINCSSSDVLYEKSGKYYVGEEYTPVSGNYPYIINNASAVMFTNGTDKLLTGTFEYVDSYENLFMSSGVTFNSDMERAYREDFILIDTGNGLYMNSDKLTVTGALTQEGTIPVNSIIHFMDDSISYYYYDAGRLVYGELSKVAKTAKITIGENAYTYLDFLEKLGLYSEKKAKAEKQPTPTDEPELNPLEDTTPAPRKTYYVTSDGTVTGLPVSDSDDNNKADNAHHTSGQVTTVDTETTDDEEEATPTPEDKDEESPSPDPLNRPTREPKPTHEAPTPIPAAEALPPEEAELGTATRTPRPTGTPRPTSTPIPAVAQTSSAAGAAPAAPAAAQPGAPAATVAPKPMPTRIPKALSGSADRPVVFPEWAKPVVTLGDVTTGAYTIFLDNFTIQNATYLYKRYGVQFYVRRVSDNRLVFTKSVTGSGALALAQPFEPNTEYSIEVILNYINPYGETIVETIVKQGDLVVKTKGRDYLDDLRLCFDKGQKASNQLFLDKVFLENQTENTTGRFIEAVQYLSKIEFEIVNDNNSNDVKKISLSASDLKKLKNGNIFDYKSSKVFQANSSYSYTIHAYDRLGQELVLKDSPYKKEGRFETCTDLPKVTFRVMSNKIYDYTVKMGLSNVGNAGIRNAYYTVEEFNGGPVETTISYLVNDASGSPVYTDPEKSYEHHIPAEYLDGLTDPDSTSGNNPDLLKDIIVKFSDLSDQTVYIVRLYAECDINNYDKEDYAPAPVPENVRWSEYELGNIKSTSASISSLGNLFLINNIPSTEENLMEGRMFMTLSLSDRTDPLLLQLVDRLELSFSKKDKTAAKPENEPYTYDDKVHIAYKICEIDDTENYQDIDSVMNDYYNSSIEQAKIDAKAAAEAAREATYQETYLNEYELEYTRQKTELEALKATAEVARYEITSGSAVGLPYDSDTYQEYLSQIEAYDTAITELENYAHNQADYAAQQDYDLVYAAKMLEIEEGMVDGFVTGRITFDEEIIRKLSEKKKNETTGEEEGYKYELRIAVDHLDTNTQYSISTNAGATVGGKKEAVKPVLTKTTFKTYRKIPTISMDAYYASSDFISLFGIGIADEDDAISAYPVELTIFNPMGQIMGTRQIKSKDDFYEEIRFNNLAKEEEYTLRFLAKECNKGWTKALSEINKEIYVNDLTDTLKIITHESIKADISLTSINDAYDLIPEKQVINLSTNSPITGKGISRPSGTLTKNTVDENTPVSSYSVKMTTTGSTSNYANVAKNALAFSGVYMGAIYTIDVDFGSDEYNIMEPCIYPYSNRFTRYQLFADANCTQALTEPYDVKVTMASDNSTQSYTRGYWTSDYIRIKQNLTGKMKLYLKAFAVGDVNNSKYKSDAGIYPLVGVSFHKFGEKAYTANINAILKDDYGQLSNGSLSSYIVKVYEKEGEATELGGAYNLVEQRLHTWKLTEDTMDDPNLCVLDMYDYKDGVLGEKIDSKEFYGDANAIDTNFGIKVKKDKYYRLELWINIHNYNIRVGTVAFTSDRFIHPIYNENDLLDAYCHPEDSYIVMNDITTANVNIYRTKQFDGVINFNGHRLTHLANDYLIYTLGAFGQIKNIVYQKGTNVDDKISNYVNVRGLVYDNYGTLQNVIVEYQNRIQRFEGVNDNREVPSNPVYTKKESNWLQGLICTNNRVTGVVRNFAVDLQEDIFFYASDGAGLAVYNNYGLVSNGYSCSTNGSREYLIATLPEIQGRYGTDEQGAKNCYTGTYYTGGTVRRNINGIVENVYGLVDMRLRNNDGNSIYRSAGAVCGLNEGFVRNSFSAAEVLTHVVNTNTYEPKKGRSPANYNFIEGTNTYGHSSNIYYYDRGYDFDVCKDNSTGRVNSVAIRKELLHDHNWYEALFDASGSSITEQWDYDFVTRGYYPHVLMDSCMPAQPSIELPKITSQSSEVTIMSAMVTENNENEAYATVTFYNPDSYLIQGIDLDYATGRVVQQWEEGQFYYAKIRVNNPTKFYSVYKITGFSYSPRTSNRDIHTKTFVPQEYIEVPIEFYKTIYTVEDFATISKGLDQNYKLGADINFNGRYIADFAATARDANNAITTAYNTDDNNNCFTGKFDGRGFTLSNIDVGNVGFLFGKVAGPLKDFNVKNIHTPDLSVYGNQKSTAEYMGLIATFRQGGSLENVHVDGAKFENVTRFCGVLLARNFFENEIKNCSVQNAVITTAMPKANSTAASVGGLVGHNDLGAIIHNCFVNNLDINAEQAGDVYGVGGIIGYTVTGIEIENVYIVNSRIKSNYANIGGIAGSIQSMNDVSTSSKSTYYNEEYYIRNYYEDVELISLSDNVGGAVGYTSKISGWNYAYGVNLGHIVTTNTAVNENTVGPVIGRYTGIDVNASKAGQSLGKHQYVYENYSINGLPVDPMQGTETETSKAAYFKTITYAQLTDATTYGYDDALKRPVLGWAEDFTINKDELQRGIMPKLQYRDSDELLPGQPDYSIKPSELEVTAINILNDSGTNENIQMEIVLAHDETIVVSGVALEGCDYYHDGLNKVEITQIVKDGKVTGSKVYGFVNIKGSDKQTILARDKYFLTGISYGKSPVVTMSAIEAGRQGLLESKYKDVYMDLHIKTRWLEIGSVNAWNQLMAPNLYGKQDLNIILTDDLDFSGASVNAYAMNVIVNQLQGRKGGTTTPLTNPDGSYNEAATVTIKGLRIYQDNELDYNVSSFIEQATGKIQGIRFEDCIVSQRTIAKSDNNRVSNRTALIAVANGAIDHVSFKNITISATNSANMAPIAFAYGVSTNIDVQDVTVAQMRRDSSGYNGSYTNRSGYIAFLGKFGGVEGFKGERIYVDAYGQYTGGVVAIQQGGCYLYDISLKDVAVYGHAAYVGGVAGSAWNRGTAEKVGKLHVENAWVYGTSSYVGGLIGRGWLSSERDGYKNVTATAGLEFDKKDKGVTDDSSRSWIKNAAVLGEVGTYTGGAVAYGAARRVTVQDSYVLGGQIVGGVVGIYSALDAIADNVYVSKTFEKNDEYDSQYPQKDYWPSMWFALDESTRSSDDSSSVAAKASGPSYTGPKKSLDDNVAGYKSYADLLSKVTGKYKEFRNKVTLNETNEWWQKALRSYSFCGWNFNDWKYYDTSLAGGTSAKVNEIKNKSAYSSDKDVNGHWYNASLTNGNVTNAIAGNSDSAIYQDLGGIAGRSMLIRGALVKDSFIYSPKTKYVGGISGTNGYWDGTFSSTAGIQGAVVKNTRVVGGSQVGGIAGRVYRYNMLYLQVDSDSYVEARDYGSITTGEYAGGIVGYQYLNSSSLSETPQLKYVYSGATVVGRDYVGGIVGRHVTDFYSSTSDSGWVMTGNVIVNLKDSTNISDVHANMFTNLDGTGWVAKGGVYDKSTLKYIRNVVDFDKLIVYDSTKRGLNQLPFKDNVTVEKTITADQFITETDKTSDRKDKVKKLTLEDLKKATTYTSTLGWPAEPTTSAYKDNRFTYKKMNYNGKLYIPQITMANAIQYDATYGMKPMFVASPDISLVELPPATFASGSGQQGSGAGVNLGLAKQSARIYVSGVDTFNVDFSVVDGETPYKLAVGGEVIDGIIDRKTITVGFDYMSDITLVIGEGDDEIIMTVAGSDLAKYIMVDGNSYYYITGSGVESATATKYGSFVNLFDGKALDTDGNVVTLVSGEFAAAEHRNGEILTVAKPLFENYYQNNRIETYATYSVIDINSQTTERDGYLIYTDGKSLQAVKTAAGTVPESYALGNDLAGTYFAVLSNGRYIDVMLDGMFKLPEDFVNEDIYEMSNTATAKVPYVAVRYTNGGLVVFNYITGEVVKSIDGSHGTATGGGTASSGSHAVSFARASELVDGIRNGAVDLGTVLAGSPLLSMGNGLGNTDDFLADSDRTAGVTGDLTVSGDIHAEGQSDVIGEGRVIPDELAGLVSEDGTVLVDSSLGMAGDTIELSSSSDDDDYKSGAAVDGSATGGGDATGGSEDGSGLSPLDGASGEGDALGGSSHGIDASNLVDGDKGSQAQGSDGVEAGGSRDLGHSEMTSMLTDITTDTSAEPRDGDKGGNTIAGTNEESGINTENGTAVTMHTDWAASIPGQEIIDSLGLTDSADSELVSVLSQLVDSGATTVTGLIEETGVGSEAKLFASAMLADASIYDGSVRSLEEAIIDAYMENIYGKELDIPEKLEEDSYFMSGEEIDAALQEYLAGSRSLAGIDSAALEFVPVLNPETGEYEMFEVNDFLSAQSYELKSVEEKLADSGKNINYHKNFNAERQAADSKDYTGLWAVALAIILAGGLTAALIYHKRKEGMR